MPPFFADFTLPQQELNQRLWRFVEGLPRTLREATLAWPQAHGIPQARLAWNSAYFFIPFWAQSEFDRDVTAECLNVAYANACLTYGVLVQDELMDNESSDRGACTLAANAFYLEAHLAYGSVFDRSSVFWRHFSPLMIDSWHCLLLERQKRLDPGLALTEQEELLQKAKVNWMKIAGVAVALLNQYPDAVPILLAHIDAWQLATQKIDDLLDWREDLTAENHTELLVRAGARGHGSTRRVEEYFGSGEIDRYLAGAALDYRAAQSHCLKADGYLFQHIADLAARLESLRDTCRTFTHLAQQLSDWQASTAATAK